MIIADLEIHSRYARACGKTITIHGLSEWAARKGVQLLSSGDITHPLWRREAERSLVERESGFYVVKDAVNNPLAPRFVLGGEVSLMFRQGEKKGRRVHVLFFAPSFRAVEALVARIQDKGKLASDGRVILSMSCRDFALVCQDADPGIMVVPAHIWTPWFGLLGSRSGFDSIEEAFEDQAGYITAFETGLSADPTMCWRVESLRKRVLISGSDLHSYPNMMREATLFNGSIDEWNYTRFQTVLSQPGHADYRGTLEFYPEEGKYHLDGHAACNVVLTPAETQRLNGICPSCGRPLTVGVLHRVEELATYPADQPPSHAGSVVYAVPLQEIIAEALGKGKQSKSVQYLYDRMVQEIATEYAILQEIEAFPQWVPGQVVEGVLRVRKGDLTIIPGYDGIYGQIRMFRQQDPQTKLWEGSQ